MVSNCFSQQKKLPDSAAIRVINDTLYFLQVAPSRSQDQETDVVKSYWEIVALYLPLIQTIFWIIFLMVFYLAFRSKIDKALKMVLRRIETGSSVKFGSLEMGPSPEMVTKTEDFARIEDKEKIYGDPDHFQTLFKVTSPTLKKSTKAMQLNGGCLVQVSTERLSSDGVWCVAESLTFVPQSKIVPDSDGGGYLRDTKREKGFHLEST